MIPFYTDIPLIDWLACFGGMLTGAIISPWLYKKITPDDEGNYG